VETASEVVVLSGHTGAVVDLVFSPDSRMLASGSTDESIRLWDLDTRYSVPSLSDHKGIITSVAFSPNGKRLASASSDTSVRLWDVETGKQLRLLSGHTASVSTLVFDHDGERIISGSEDGSIVLWDAEAGDKLARLPASDIAEVRFMHGDKELGGPDRKPVAVTCIALNQDGRMLASANGNGWIVLWDIDTHEPVGRYYGHTIAQQSDEQSQQDPDPDPNIFRTLDMLSFIGGWRPVRIVIFSPDGEFLASGSDDGSIKLLDVEKGEIAKELSIFDEDKSYLSPELRNLERMSTKVGHSALSLAFSPDGRLLASGSEDSDIRLWNIAQSKQVATFSGHAAPVLSVEFNHNGKYLASGSSDGTVRIWKVDSSKEVAIMYGHTGSVSTVAFSPDSTLLASGSADTNIRLWLSDRLELFSKDREASLKLRRIYDASFCVMPFQLQGNNLVPKSLYQSPFSRDPQPDHCVQYDLDHPRPTDKDLVEWILETNR
jgi:WD40 repeat protein